MTDIPTPQSAEQDQFVTGIDADGKITSSKVGIQQLDYTGRFGALATSTTQNDISIGDHEFTLDIDDDLIRIQDDVLISSPDKDCFMWGEVTKKVTTVSPCKITVYVDDVSRVTATFNAWTIQVIARPKPGIEKDISLTSFDPTDDGPFTLTITAGKFFPVGGTLLIKPNDDRSVALLATVRAYTGTSLVIDKQETNATVSQDYDSWAIALLDAPKGGIPFNQRNGLVVSISGTTLTVTAGSMRDSTDTYDLVLPSTITKDLTAAFAAGSGNGAQIFSANLAGTISTSGSSITGTGTAFLSDFAVPIGSLGFVDFTSRNGTLYSTAGNLASTSITANGVTARVILRPSDTSMTAAIGGTTSGLTYQRGGWAGGAIVNYGVLLLRKDSDGSIDVGVYSLYPGSTPDLLTGWSVYGALAQLWSPGGPLIVNQWQGGTSFDQLAPTITEGDLIYFHSGTNARLGVGTAGQVLTSDGTDPAWANRIKTVASGSFPAAANLDVAIPAGYSDIQISWSGWSTNTASRGVGILFFTDGGTTPDTTIANYDGLNANGGVATTVASILTDTTATAASTWNGSVVISGYSSAAYKQYLSFNHNSAAGRLPTIGTYTNTAAITNIRFLVVGGSGNFDAGTYVVTVK